MQGLGSVEGGLIRRGGQVEKVHHSLRKSAIGHVLGRLVLEVANKVGIDNFLDAVHTARLDWCGWKIPLRLYLASVDGNGTGVELERGLEAVMALLDMDNAWMELLEPKVVVRVKVWNPFGEKLLQKQSPIAPLDLGRVGKNVVALARRLRHLKGLAGSMRSLAVQLSLEESETSVAEHLRMTSNFEVKVNLPMGKTAHSPRQVVDEDMVFVLAAAVISGEKQLVNVVESSIMEKLVEHGDHRVGVFAGLLSVGPMALRQHKRRLLPIGVISNTKNIQPKAIGEVELLGLVSKEWKLHMLCKVEKHNPHLRRVFLR